MIYVAITSGSTRLACFSSLLFSDFIQSDINTRTPRFVSTSLTRLPFVSGAMPANSLQSSVNNNNLRIVSSALDESSNKLNAAYYDQFSANGNQLVLHTTNPSNLNTSSKMLNATDAERRNMDGFNYGFNNDAADDPSRMNRNLEVIPNAGASSAVLIDTTDISKINNINRSNLQRKLFIDFSMNPQKDTVKNPVSRLIELHCELTLVLSSSRTNARCVDLN